MVGKPGVGNLMLLALHSLLCGKNPKCSKMTCSCRTYQGIKTSFIKWVRKNYNCFEVFMISLHVLYCNMILKSLSYNLYILLPEGFFYAKLINSVSCWAVIQRYSKSYYILSWITQRNIFGNRDESHFTITTECQEKYLTCRKSDLGETVAALTYMCECKRKVKSEQGINPPKCS